MVMMTRTDVSSGKKFEALMMMMTRTDVGRSSGKKLRAQNGSKRVVIVVVVVMV